VVPFSTIVNFPQARRSPGAKPARMPDTDGRHNSGRIWIDALIAASAIVISLASLWVAVREGRTQERLLSASVWPYLQYGSSNVSVSTGVSQLDFTLQNAGVGPARLQWVTFYYNGKAYATALEAFAACCSAKAPLPTITEGLQDRVLTAGQTATFIHLPKRPSDEVVWNAIDRVRLGHMYVRGCYCSVLDECWLLDSRGDAQPKRVSGCPPAEDPRFKG
jgi:hypothetical protein